MDTPSDRPARWPERALHWIRRHGGQGRKPVFLALAAGMALVLLASYVQVLEGHVARAQAAQQFAQAHTERPEGTPVAARAADAARSETAHTR